MWARLGAKLDTLFHPAREVSTHAEAALARRRAADVELAVQRASAQLPGLEDRIFAGLTQGYVPETTLFPRTVRLGRFELPIEGHRDALPLISSQLTAYLGSKGYALEKPCFTRVGDSYRLWEAKAELRPRSRADARALIAALDAAYPARLRAEDARRWSFDSFRATRTAGAGRR